MRAFINLRRIGNFSLHAFFIACAYFLAYLFRLDLVFFDSPRYIHLFWGTLLPLLVIRLGFYWFHGLFGGIWRFTGVKDLQALARASLQGTLAFAIYAYFFHHGTNVPRSVPILDFILNILILGGVRMAVRIYWDSGRKSSKDRKDSKNILIVGAGKAGEILLREIKDNHSLGYHPVGFVDDDRNKRNLTIHGVKVIGNTRDICKLTRFYSVGEIIIALPSAKPKQFRRIVSTCKRAGVKVKTLPFIGDILDGKGKISQIRDVAIEDLLGRESAKLDMTLVGKELTGKIVMVTGAAGSIGSEIVRQAARFRPKKIVMFDRAENDIYHLEMELKGKESETTFDVFVGDVIDADRLRECVTSYRPAYVFHAAAYKHVPMMELNPSEAVKNNVFGTKNIVDLADELGVEKFVLISTDKAVRPTNVMGATKRIAELILQEKSAAGSKTQFVAVRFGNVLGSNGSVIPLFKRQIEQGGPVTVTHPDITRYFMTIPEAVQLVIQAGAMGRGGEIFVLEMGDPVKILDLAKNLIQLSGLAPGKDIEITYTGLRPGEKLFEELLIQGEGVIRTHHDKIWVLEGRPDGLDSLSRTLSRMQTAAKNGKATDIKPLLKELVPEYRAGE
ncbi:MAG: polysaccharide biosynthesis protein [Nitrospinae bacterium]|nr:polysaccharide biosynthesis protein [Nitrospinota bacterium]